MKNREIKNSKNLTDTIKQHLSEASLLNKCPLIVILGPTASGKTSLGIALAQYFGGEIVSADSRQIYREMSIGTAKPTNDEMTLIKHHLIDFVNPDESYNLARFQSEALAAIKKIHSKKAIPFLVGGTGLYISAITQNYSLSNAEPNERLRDDMENLAVTRGVKAVHDRLCELDKEVAERIHPNNLRYVIRAIEVLCNVPHNGKKAQKLVFKKENFHMLYISIDWPREKLYERINKRIDIQIKNGLLEETQKLLEKYDISLPSMSSLGYSELGAFLRGEQNLDEAIEDFKRNTRNYAKRQLTWFRRFKCVYSIPGALLDEIILDLKNKKFD